MHYLWSRACPNAMFQRVFSCFVQLRVDLLRRYQSHSTKLPVMTYASTGEGKLSRAPLEGASPLASQGMVQGMLAKGCSLQPKQTACQKTRGHWPRWLVHDGSLLQPTISLCSMRAKEGLPCQGPRGARSWQLFALKRASTIVAMHTSDCVAHECALQHKTETRIGGTNHTSAATAAGP